MLNFFGCMFKNSEVPNHSLALEARKAKNFRIPDFLILAGGWPVK